MAWFTKIFIITVLAIAAECTFPLLHGGMGPRGIGMGIGTMGVGMRWPWMYGGGGMMYPGMMGYKEQDESSDKPGSDNPRGPSTVVPLPNPSSLPKVGDNPEASEIREAIGDLADHIRQGLPKDQDQNQAQDH